MTDPRYAPPHSGRRSPTLNNPARLSMPVVPTIPTAGPGYSPYVGAVPILPPGHYDPPSRRQTNPPPATTYPVTHDPMNRGSSVRQVSNGPASRAHRSATIDSSNNNRPVIITTSASNRPHAGSSHSSGRGSDRSPIREPLRPGDNQSFSQPASSVRSRASHRPTYSTSLDNEDLLRLRDRTGDPRHLGLADPYRPGRGPPPGPVYSNIPPRQRSIPTVEDGYEYTDPGALARYDLEHTRPAPGNSRRRRESLDRGGYYRPSVFVNAGYDRTRPPPASRGLERYNWNAAAGIYDNPNVRMPVPPAVPPPPPSDSSRRPDPAMTPVTRRERPVSMYLEERSNHDPPYYLPREEERHHRERREPDREYDGSYEPNYFHDDNVGTRGFGIRTEDNYDTTTTASTYRRPGREYVEMPPEPQRRSDEDALDQKDDRDRRARADRERRRPEDDRDREKRPPKEDRDPGRTSLRDKITAGLGATAAAIGILSKDGGKEPREDSRRRRSPDEDRRDERRPEAEPRDRSHSRHGERESKRTARVVVKEDKDDADRKDKERNRHDAEPKVNGDSASSSGQLTPTSEEEREANAARPNNKRGRVTSFKPTDTADLLEVKAKLAELNVSEKGKDKDKDSDSGSAKGSPSPEKRVATPAPPKEESGDESRGRELVKVPEKTEKQVRVVSPPREKSEAKPLKGILKAPSQKFPEEPNPVREGVAPHKDDKTKKDAPPGARWTKIRRDIVNPEALTAGKERFEVRDSFVIVLRVLNKEEIEQYAYATQLIREKRHDERLLREKQERESEHEHAKDRDKDDDERRRQHRQHRREEEVDERKYRERDYDRDRERERHRRHRHEDEGEYQLMLEDAPKQIEYPGHNHGVYHRSHRDRETAQV